MLGCNIGSFRVCRLVGPTRAIVPYPLYEKFVLEFFSRQTADTVDGLEYTTARSHARILFFHVFITHNYETAHLDVSRVNIAVFMKGVRRNDSSLHMKSKVIWLCNSHTYWRKHNAGAVC